MDKPKKTFRFGKQYFRYLISYVLILLIPLTILTYFYSSRFMKKFYHEIYETVDLELMQLSTQLENQFVSMQNISSQLTMTGTIQKALSAKTPLALEPVITTLSQFRMANSFIDEIALVMENQDYIVTSFTTCEKDHYFNRFLQIPGQNAEELEELFLRGTSLSCLPSQEIQNPQIGTGEIPVLIFSMPIFTDYQKCEGSILFLVQDVSVQNLLNQKLQSYQAQIYILDNNKNIITTSGPNPDAIRSDSDKYIIRSYQSADSSWTYLAYLPDQQATFSQVSDIMRDFMIAIILILVVSGLTIYWLQKVNYRPVQELRDKAIQISHGKTSNNELAEISNTLDYLSAQNASLSTHLANNLTIVKNERLFRLISGRYASREDFNMDCSELEMELTNEYFTIIILMLHDSLDNLDEVSQEIKKVLDAPYYYYYLHSFHPNQIILLANLPSASTSVLKPLAKTQEYLQKRYHLSTTIGIGTVENTTDQIGCSYMNAATALDYRFVKGNGSIIQFQEVIGTDRASVTYPHQEFELLHTALLSRKETAIRSSIQAIIRFMEQNRLPLYLARSICFDLIHMVNEHFYQQKDSVSGSPLELTGVETSQEIIQMIRNWSRQLGNLNTTHKVDFREVLSYIDARCLNCDFSVYDAAEHFEMPLPSFSKFFKEHAGQNVMDYTISMRIQKAKKLLADSNLPLKDIAEQVGYYNVSSFTRRFKLSMGITPGEYRKLSKTSEESI